MLGTTVSYNSSFANQNAISISGSYSYGISDVLNGTVTTSFSSSWTSTRINSSSVSIQQQSSQSYKLPGVPNAYSPSNHDYDVIWLWLNPVEPYSVNTTVNTIQFTGQGTSYRTQRTFGIDQQFKGSGDYQSFAADLKLSNTMTSMHSQTTQTTRTNQAIDSLSISPPCAAIQCTPAYTGFSEFDVYQDNLFGTFMFYPVR